jgi:hypothetical protein
VRKVTRDIDEEVRDHVRALANTEAFHRSRRERKKVEILFAHMKRIFEARPAAAKGLEWRPRRGSARRHRPELAKTRQVCRATATDGASRLCCVSSACVEHRLSAADPLETRRQSKHPDIPQKRTNACRQDVLQHNPGISGHPKLTAQGPLMTPERHGTITHARKRQSSPPTSSPVHVVQPFPLVCARVIEGNQGVSKRDG